MNKQLMGILVGLALVLVPALSMASSFELAKESKVNFVAKITGSSFKGECETVIGTAILDAANQKLSTLEFSLKAEDIKTGMDQRDGHMYEKYLETKAFPRVTFKAVELQLPAPGKSKQVEGTFGVHGQEKNLKVLFAVTENTPEKIVLTATWVLNIGDFGIKRPKFMVVKMEKELQMDATVVLVRKRQ